MADKPKRALLNVEYTNVAPLTREMKRVADALEVLLLLQYGYRMTPTSPPRDGDVDEQDVQYADDASTFKNELEAIARGRKPLDVIEDED